MPVQVTCPSGHRPEIHVTPLGAGQDVGRSCILLRVAGKHIMLDCGMHMGYNDERRFPDFSFIDEDAVSIQVGRPLTGSTSSTSSTNDLAPHTKTSVLTERIDCVIISHFHLDHCGALPFMTEMIGYNGPIYMTFPTKAICPILLEDMRRVCVERNNETNFFTSNMIKDCMRKVTPVSLHQTVRVDDQIEIKAYYAGHVLGAAMFHIAISPDGRSLSPTGSAALHQRPITVVYTGDYNMTPDRHLGAAWIDRCEPDLLITESTYATTIRDSKRCREGDFLKKVHECVHRGGKVLIPVFALGRAQELCILLETYWDRMNLGDVPIYYSAGITERANQYYKLFIAWTNEKIKRTFVDRNMFDFKHIKPLERSYINNPGPMVVFATPGMLHGGLSLAIFEEWCTSASNMIILPGYCVAGTVGNKILNGQRRVEVRKGRILDVRMSVQYMSFSAHADAKGILQLIDNCRPKNVLLVHGEGPKMEFLKGKILDEFAAENVATGDLPMEVFMPANGETSVVKAAPLRIPVFISNELIRLANTQYRQIVLTTKRGRDKLFSDRPKRLISGLAVLPTEPKSRTKATSSCPMMRQSAVQVGDSRFLPDSVVIYSAHQGCSLLSSKVKPLSLRFTYNMEMDHASPAQVVDLLNVVADNVSDHLHVDRGRISIARSGEDDSVGRECELAISTATDCVLLKVDLHTGCHVEGKKCEIVLSWAYQDEALGAHILDTVTAMCLTSSVGS